ncbi:MAG: hypothetical protein K5675_09335 [Lachnospiraceae bacterium]|nr:hypothetical protein [Lachnospiraceae bacterium]
MEENQKKFSVKDIAVMGLMVAIIEVCKMALSFAPNIELTSFWLIMFTKHYGKKVALIVPALILLEGMMYGVNIWWIMYAYIWPLLVILAYMFRKVDSALFWAIFSGIFGLCFGFLCSITYFVIGASGGSITAGLSTAFSWWVAGITWDVIHCVGNFTLMLVLYIPIENVLKRQKQ